jgi:hypothetical protein
MKIIIETIPHAEQRYPTVGDWYWDDRHEIMTIRVSKSEDWHTDLLVIVHELVEAILCECSGVSQKYVDAFDMSHLDSDEPGDEPDAPYRDQHCFAMAVERMMCAAMGVSWKEHEARLEKLK